MKKHLFSLTSLVIFLCYSLSAQNEKEFAWELKRTTEKLHINHSGINLWILHAGDYTFNKKGYKVTSEKFPALITTQVIGWTPDKGLQVTLGFANDASLLGQDCKLIISNDSTNQIIGAITIPIGSDEPKITSLNSYGQLPINQGSRAINIYGTNMNGIIEILSDDTYASGLSISDKRSENYIKVNMTANTPNAQSSTKYRFSYWDYNTVTKQVEKKQTGIYELPIQIVRSSAIELKLEKNIQYIEDIRRNGAVFRTRIGKYDAGAIGNDGPTIDLMQSAHLHTTSDVTFDNNNSTIGNIVLVFSSPDDLKQGEFRMDMKAKSGQEYFALLKLLNDPTIDKTYNKNGGQIFLTKTKNQHLMIEGKNFTDSLTLVAQNPMNIGIVRIEGDGATQIEYQLNLNQTLRPGNHYLSIKEGQRTVHRFSLQFENPQAPQRIAEFCNVKQDTVYKGLSTNPIELSTENDISLFFNNLLIVDTNGKQSLTIKIKYFDESGKLIGERDGIDQNNNSSLIIGKGDRDLEVKIHDVLSNEDLVRKWGEIRVEIRHASDFYKQDLDKKEVVTQRIILTDNIPVAMRIALTVPPALFIFGYRQENKYEFLPINVGFGGKLYWRTKVGNYYRKSKASVGLYFAGINFAGKTVGGETNETEGKRRLINPGDIALMALLQLELRRDDNFVKLPILIGPGVALPFGTDKTWRGFFTFGIGINL